MRRFRLIAAVGAVAMLAAALSGSSAYGGSSGSAQGSPIKIGALVPLTPGASNFVPWGPGARRDGHGGERDQQVGRRQGPRAGARLNLVVADDQSTNTTAAVDGFRRLTQQEGVVSVGGIIGSPIALATCGSPRRECRCS